MKRPSETSSIFTGSVWTGAAILAVAVAVATAQAQPPERPDGPPQRGARGERGGPREGRGGPGGPPSPERFVEHALKFDADGDGKLDRGELTKFAEEIQRMRQPGGGRGERGPGEGGPGEGGPGGDRPRGDGPGFGGAGRPETGRERGRERGEFGGADGFRRPPRADEGASGAERPRRPE